LRERFGIVSYLDFYEAPDLAVILKRSAEILKIRIDEDAAIEIAGRSRGTPRIANRLLRRVRDFAQVAKGHINLEVARKALSALEVDAAGLDRMDRKIILAIIDKFSGGPVGLETIAVAVSEESQTIEDVYEPFLIKAGFLARTSRGRVVTPTAYRHFQRPAPQSPPTDFPLFSAPAESPRE
jgi:Holliday junction DNA helicase RuvB